MADQTHQSPPPLAKAKASKFEVIMPDLIFRQMEDWRHNQGWKRSKTLCTAILRMMAAPIPLHNRRFIGFTCLGCGKTWPTGRVPEKGGHPSTLQIGEPCKGNIAVVVE